MSECQLILNNIEQKSKAPKFFKLFRPKELVYHEPFELSFSIENKSGKRFEGGKLDFVILGKLR
jgi:hypothetical protein